MTCSKGPKVGFEPMASTVRPWSMWYAHHLVSFFYLKEGLGATVCDSVKELESQRNACNTFPEGLEKSHQEDDNNFVMS